MTQTFAPANPRPTQLADESVALVRKWLATPPSEGAKKGSQSAALLAEVLKALRIAGKGLPQVQTAAICGERGLQLRPLRSLVATEGGHGGFRMWGGENRRDSNLITQFI